MILSTFLCLSVVAVWFRSRTVTDHWMRARVSIDRRGAWVDSNRGLWFGKGRAVVYWNQLASFRGGGEGGPVPKRGPRLDYSRLDAVEPRDAVPGLEDAKGGFAGFFVAREIRGPHSGVIVIPFWMPVLVFGLTTVVAGRRLYRGVVRQSRLSRGLCQSCGYDLRASPQTCPECGSPNPAKM
jgi:hypothetical protein